MIESFYIIPRIGGLAYLNNSKAACSSVLLALSQMRKRNDFEPPKDLLPDGSHPIHGFHPNYTHTEYFFRRWPSTFPPLPDSFIKFSFVRNPYARFYSFYRSKIMLGQRPGAYYERFDLRKGASFEECVRIITSLDPQELEHHSAPQTMTIVNDESLLVDFLGKVEDLSNDWPIILKLTGFDLELQRLNVSRDSSEPLYSPETKELIYNYYRNDFDLFSYEKNSILPEIGPYEIDAGSVFKDHIYPSELINRLKKESIASNEKIRHLAEEFTKNTRKRDDFFKKQAELFREMLCKNTFHLETELTETIREQTFIKQKQSKIVSDIREADRKISKGEEDHQRLQEDQQRLQEGQQRLQEDHQRLQEDQQRLKEDQQRLKEGQQRLQEDQERLQEGHQRLQEGQERLQNLYYKNILITFRRAESNLIKSVIRFLRFPLLSQAKLLHKSGLVDPGYYFEKYPRTIEAGMTAAQHYMRYGVFLGMNPSKDFNTLRYLAEHPDVAHDGINPLVHFVLNKKDKKR